MIIPTMSYYIEEQRLCEVIILGGGGHDGNTGSKPGLERGI